MKNKDCLEWNSRILSSANALTIASLGVYAFYKDQKLLEDPFYYSNRITKRILFGLLGYFIYDALLVAKYYRIFSDRGALIHHALFISALSVGGYKSIFHGLGLFFTMNEVSTLSLNLRWHFNKYEQLSKQKVSHRVKTLNLLFLFVGFFFGRIVVNSYATYKTCTGIFLSVHRHPASIKAVASIIPLLLLLNYYWFWLMIKRIRGTR